jgi:type IV pilus assembly protein PilO
MADNALTKLPIAGQIGVALLLSALAGGLFWYLSYSPMQDQETAKTAQLAKLRQDIKSLEVTVSKLDEFQRDVAAKEAKLETLKRILPADKEMPELMKKIQYLASQSNLGIRKFTPGSPVKKSFQPAAASPAPGAPPARPTPAPRAGAAGAAAAPVPQDFYQELPINVEVEGTYHNLGLFFDRVSRLSRLVKMGEVKIKTPSKQTASATISVGCQATTYMYVETPATPTSPAPAARPR